MLHNLTQYVCVQFLCIWHVCLLEDLYVVCVSVCKCMSLQFLTSVCVVCLCVHACFVISVHLYYVC